MAQNGTSKAMFVAELAAGRSVAEASKAAGISRRTAARWHNEPDVQAELERMRRATLSHARDVLLGMVDEAAGWLRRVGRSDDSPAAVVSAARVVYTQARALVADTDVEERLSAVEQYIEAQQRWRATS